MAACPAAAASRSTLQTCGTAPAPTMDPVGSASSLTVDPPTLAGQGTCAASVPSIGSVEGGKTIAITCQSPRVSVLGDVPGDCPSGDDQQCTYPNVPGFTVCTGIAPGASCADLPGWPVQHTFFFASCNCSCGPATGEVCSTTLTACEDGSCSDAVASVTVNSNDGPMCGNVSPPASPLGSKKASVTYTPGTCAATPDAHRVRGPCAA